LLWLHWLRNTDPIYSSSLINRLKPFRKWLVFAELFDDKVEKIGFRKLSLKFINFFYLTYRYGVGIFTFEIFLLDFPF
jgi:hypothetical protein